MADIVKDTFDRNKRQNKVIFQQKKPLLNFELNLAQDVLNNKIQNLQKLSVSNSYTGDSFKIVPGSMNNEVVLKKGLLYHNGYPIELTYDQNISCNPSGPAPTRTDTVYLEWWIEEVDGYTDLNIGFVTTREEQLKYSVSVVEMTDPLPTNETIQFDNLTKTITLSVGYFPNWLRVQGVRFKTNSTLNSGSPYFTVQSSASNKVITVTESIASEILDNVKFTQYESSGAEPQSFIAYRKNIIILAKITRTLGVEQIYSADISDYRDKFIYNFVKNGCEVTESAGLSVSIEEGGAFVGDMEVVIESTTPDISLIASQTNYVYVNDSGVVVSSITEPTTLHLMLAEVRTDISNVVLIENKKTYIPFAWNYKYGEGGEGETGYPSLIQKFKADENINKYNLVYPSSSSAVSKSSASAKITMPVIGIAPQSFSTGQIDNIVTYGEIENSAWSWTPRSTIFASTASGDLVDESSLPGFTTGTYIQRIGTAISSTKILFNPDQIIIKKDATAELAVLVLRSNGDIEVIGDTDKLNPDRLSFLAPSLIPSSTSFEIFPGRFFINDTDNYLFGGTTIQMGLTGTTYKTTALPNNYYNKAYFTIGSDNIVHMYEGSSDSVIPTENPEIPSNELPICVVTFQDNGLGLAGSIKNLDASSIVDKRGWLNLGNLDSTCFKAIFKDYFNVIINKGDAWFNNRYFILNSNTILTANINPGTSYIYLDLTGTGTNFVTTVNASNFLISQSTPNQMDRRLYIPLGTYQTYYEPIVSSNVVDVSTFIGFKGKFWQYRDTPYTDETVFSYVPAATASFLATFNFLSTDYLDIQINGISSYEIDDYTKDPNTRIITFGYPVKKGAKIKIRKV